MPNSSTDRPNPDGWEGGREDFETIWSLKGAKMVPLTSTTRTAEQLHDIQANRGRLHDADGF